MDFSLNQIRFRRNGRNFSLPTEILYGSILTMYRVRCYTTFKKLCDARKIDNRYYCSSTNTFSNNEILHNKKNYIPQLTGPRSDDIGKTHSFVYSFIVRDSIIRQLDTEFHDVIKRYDEFCNYVGKNRQLNLSVRLLRNYQYLEEPENFTAKNVVLACTLAWCLEIIATALILEDDIMDRSKIRWKNLCWHEKPEIGLTALIDIKQIRISAFRIFRKYFTGHPFYAELMHLLCKANFTTALGQSLDFNTASNLKRKSKLNFFTIEMYESIGKYKTGYMLYKVPLLAAMYLTQNDIVKIENDSLMIIDKLTNYRHAQNDALDVFGKYEDLGKFGNDIENGKCAWPIVTAVLHANETQLKLLEEHYGKEELSSKQIILNVYKELDLLNKFLEYKNNLLQDLKRDISQLSNEPLRRVFQNITKADVEAYEDFVKY